jgi:hypothetical protein
MAESSKSDGSKQQKNNTPNPKAGIKPRIEQRTSSNNNPTKVPRNIKAK